MLRIFNYWRREMPNGAWLGSRDLNLYPLPIKLNIPFISIITITDIHLN
jgi:hypothetical protein